MDSKKDNILQVNLGGRKMDVPIYKDKDTTITLVKRVNERIEEIEKNSLRIDTQAFVLQAAFSFATEAMKHSDESQENTRDLLVELDALDNELTRLIREHQIEKG